MPNSALRNRGPLTCIVSIAGLVAAIATGPATAQPPTGAFPPIPPGATSYQITPAEANGLVIGTLYLPKNFTLTVDPSVKAINWSANNIVFEDGATIDLSSPTTVWGAGLGHPMIRPIQPGRGPDGANQGGQQGYCTPGADGGAGGNGPAGINGVDLTIVNVNPLSSSGTLWIKTDGGPGGDGGNGGNGQLGGGARAVGLFHGGHCDAAHGGSGGRGGAGGAGGRPGKVTILFAIPGAVPPSNGTAPTCGSTQRPAIPTGTLAIWGGAGCPGRNGRDGFPGGHG
jgi:hypothetical protein